ncbi:MAG: radical SAM protein [Candidatus Bathyarchaeia archaeon]
MNQKSGNNLTNIDHIPFLAALNITKKCNLKCVHCAVNAQNKGKEELTTEEIFTIIDECQSLGVHKFLITGGEPFTRHDIISILKFINDKKIDTVVLTNGTLITKETVRILKSLDKCKWFGVSVDGITPKSHNYFRGIPNALALTLKGIDYLLEADKYVEIITVLTKLNVDEIPRLHRYTRKLGVTLRIIPKVCELGRGQACAEALNLSIEEVIKFAKGYVFKEMEKDYRHKRVTKFEGFNNLPTIHIHLPLPLYPPSLIKFSFTCQWGKSLCGILLDGKVAICDGVTSQRKLIAGSLKEKKLEDIWLHSDLFQKLRKIKPDDFKGVCGNCLCNDICRGGCRLYAVDKYGGILSPDPFCQELYERGLFPKYALINPERSCHFLECD